MLLILNLLNLEEELCISDTADTRPIHLIITCRFCFFFSSCLSAFIQNNLTFRHKHLLFCPIICANFSLIQTAKLSSIRMTPAGLAPSRLAELWMSPPGLSLRTQCWALPGWQMLHQGSFWATARSMLGNTACGSASWVSAHLRLLHLIQPSPVPLGRSDLTNAQLS